MVNLGSQRSSFSSHNLLGSYPLAYGSESLENYRGTNDSEEALIHTTYGLEHLGIYHVGWIYRNLPIPQLIEHAILRGEGTLADNGALMVETGKYTGRSPKDRFIVRESSSQDEIDWNQHNVPISEDKFSQLYHKVIAYLQGKDLYIFDGYVGADNNYRCGVRIINELASQNLFAHQLFIRPSPQELGNHQADFTVIAVPGLQGNPETDGIHSEAFIVVHLQKRLVIIGGSRYAGEIKKSVFSMMNYFMTKRNVLPMHCAANIDKHAHTTLFFGLSGTGKTTLSADPDCSLIGDDEHGWSTNGIFNFEGGCYAKTIRLSQENEPQIWAAIRFGTLLENVIFEPETQIPDYDDGRLTENTRAAYPLLYIPNCSTWGVGSHPKTIFFLTADAFGVLPPIAKLTKDQAMYHFLAGYTSKLAGTERDINAPQATFSACFGQCFFPLSPLVYAKMLGERLEQHEDTQVFLINTGWSGGPYGVGHRISIKHTRAMVAAALNGQLKTVNYHSHPIFKVLIPEHIIGVPNKILDPENTWTEPEAYQQQALELAHLFEENFKQFKEVPPEIIAAGPVPFLS
ncbi:phosphoenolpyruvate carboxykinase (ATP) [Crocosphaera sp. UHCC 0190]|uniref:phosphoenolpyruvate carboxykinase (ATP) n=1 Tax=Crocosphaera sp. UHCC 0190 TaxID=3110246 RepID=UPI002B208976|nr:phosphoenolpyruvate carboxykinase (ATP) [Crocosphaera sp. UHCC 0190]MEA5508701.1 phosphoenolpyruvate carboxykinase (ATP) [Crocosphaera sp. UHCC 0190]